MTSTHPTSTPSPSAVASAAATPDAQPAGTRRARRVRTEPATGLAAWIELTKPRIMVLLLITCVAGMLCAEQGLPSLALMLATSVGLALSSGGASALNHVIDRDIDRRMTRTAMRPVAAGTISPRAASVFGVMLMVLSAVVLWPTTNPLTTALALAGGLLYVILYTVLLKRTTAQNIVIGGVAGAIPPLVGWAAVEGSIGAGGWVLFTIVFLWTPPHFWALALLIREEYAAAGVPMLPVVAGERATCRQIWWYSVVLVGATIIPVAFGTFGMVYLVGAVVLGARLLQRAWQLRSIAMSVPEGETVVVPGSAGHVAARRMFLYSMAYLALLFGAAVIDQVI